MSCVECIFYKEGICNWFTEPKKIPSKVFDKGCNQHRSEFVQKLIDMFDGEIIK